MNKEIRYDVNGLKAIAIIAVVVYHLFDLLNSGYYTDNHLFDGGFLGVDIFFVISGFLITSSIYPKVLQSNFSIKEFYLRRAFRIYPPLLVVCIFSLVVGYFLIFPEIYLELAREVANVIIATGNFRFANLGGYFALGSSDKVLLHSWYLCITIQFYILFPCLIAALNKLLGTDKLKISIVCVFVLSVISALYFSQSGKGYLLTHTRIFELLFGSVIYLYKDNFEKLSFVTVKFRQVLEVFGLCVTVLSIFVINQKNGVWLVSTSAMTMFGTACVLLAHAPETILKNKFWQILGKSSYSLYLWHWPIFIFVMRIDFALDDTHLGMMFGAVAICTYLSYKYTEQKKISPKTTLVLALACLAAYGVIKHFDGTNYLSKFMVKEASRVVNTDVALDSKYQPSIVYTHGNGTIYKYGLQSETPHLFVIGDSHADQYSYYFKEVSKLPVYFLQWHANMCYGKNMLALQDTILTSKEDRLSYYTLYMQMLQDLKPHDKVLFSNRWDVYFKHYAKEYNIDNTLENYSKFLPLIISDLDEQVRLHPEIQFYIAGEGVITSSKIVNCLKTDLSESFLSVLLSKKTCSSTINYLGKKYDLTNDALREYAQSRDNVTFIDRNVPLRIKDGLYKTFSESGLPLYYDDNHLSSEGGIIVGSYIIEQIQSNTK